MNHIVNGDIVGEKIKQLKNVIVWREMYDFGPFNRSWSTEELFLKRADFFEKILHIPSSLFFSNCLKQYNQLKDLPKREEVVLWFEHDRYDQLMLMYLLTELSTLGFEKISLISMNEYPNIEPFYGMGLLTSKQLLNLLEHKQVVTKEQIDEAVLAWNSFRSDDSNEIDRWIETQMGELPFLKQALIIHKSYFPTDKTGLNAVETLALSLIYQGVRKFSDLFNKVSSQRVNDGLSDFYFAALLNELMKGEKPLLKTDKELPNFQNPEPTATLEITKEGIEVLDGRRNRKDLVGIDWWVGGVHLKED